ncbi:class A beta-lactamase-related serine hydrolase [Candidatus Parcubacteria bacterium]|nr:class A beta-lactamase-related serine hydrolase [Candidatus Parcubacteria bacterium]
MLWTIHFFLFGPHLLVKDARGILSETREGDSDYALINPLLSCGDTFSHLLNRTTQELEATLRSRISSEENKGNLVNGAVYFRSLNGGPAFGIHEDTLFIPGSLLKVPLVLSVYKKAEKDTSLLSKQIIYDGGSVPYVEHYQSDTIKIGSTYTVEDLVKAALVHSDNNAAILLTQLISVDDLDDSYKDLGMQIPTQGADYQTTVQTYASFFRILYNATYLTHDASEHLLEILTQTTFNEGLIKGLPQGVKVAHKFGERALADGVVQLHDCGIVYKPGDPYLICVMMQGHSYDTLAGEISSISKIVYDAVQ